MELFIAALEGAWEALNLEFTLFGVTFSMWQVFAFDAVAGVVAWMIGRIFLDG